MTPELAAHPLSQVARVLTWGALAMLSYGALAWAAAQPWFALRSIEVAAPVAHVTEAQLRLIAERQVRGTFFTVDLDEVRTSLEKLPWVREARVERRWPDTLVVALTEHEPLARWNEDALVSDAGEVFVAAAAERLPRLVGPEGTAAEVVAAYRRHQAVLAPLDMKIAALRLSPRRAWRIRLANGVELALGREHTEARLARFVALYPRVFASDAVTSNTGHTSEPVLPLVVDLRYPDGFAVRMPAGKSPFKASEHERNAT